MTDTVAERKTIAWLFALSIIAATFLPATFRGYAFEQYITRPTSPRTSYGLLWTSVRGQTEATFSIGPGLRDGSMRGPDGMGQTDWDLLAWAGVLHGATLLLAALLALTTVRGTFRHAQPSRRISFAAELSLAASVAFWLTSMLAIFHSGQVPLPSPLGIGILATWVVVAIAARRLRRRERQPPEKTGEPNAVGQD